MASNPAPAPEPSRLVPPAPHADHSGAMTMRALVLAALVVGAGIVVAVASSDQLLFGLYSPELHVVLDTVDGCVAALVATLLLTRARTRGRLTDQLLGEALMVFAAASWLSVVADLGDMSEVRAVWTQLAARSVGAGLILASVIVPARVSRGQGHGYRAAAAVVILVVVGVISPWLPVPVDSSAAQQSAHVEVTGHAALVAAQGFSATAVLVAAVVVTRRAWRRPDPLMTWLAPGLVLGGFSRINYALFPSIYSGWFYTGDLLRTASYLLMLVGAVREIRAHWARESQSAVEAERQRIARELHDGVAQEIALIQMVGLPLVRRDPSRDVSEILDAADRALEETRTAIDTLRSSTDDPIGTVLVRSAQRVAARHGATVEAFCEDLVLDPARRHEVLRIVGEAVSNAVRHGAARRVELRLERVGRGARLLVRDDGRGFDVAAQGDGEGFGLRAMAQRGEKLGGSCAVRSAPGEGTTVEVVW